MDHKHIRVMTILGTRPEAIKLAPIIKELEHNSGPIKSIVVLTGQHREMLDQVTEIFGIQADYDLQVMSADQKLQDVLCRVITRFSAILSAQDVDLILVQGDTTTTLAASLSGFYHKIPIGHVEAGLRTHNRYFPFPEELNRTLVSRLATFHFAPTLLSKQNLLQEGIQEKDIIVSGNSVIDALLYILKKEGISCACSADTPKYILVTAHRRENWGRPLENICGALLDIVEMFPEVEVVFPCHLNPNTQNTVHRSLQAHRRIKLLQPLDYISFCRWLARSFLILTDSGGIQEEAPSLGKPVLVLRNETERTEATDAGTARLVGTSRQDIVREAASLLTNPAEYQKMAQRPNPFGDGKASKRIVRFILENFCTNHPRASARSPDTVALQP